MSQGKSTHGEQESLLARERSHCVALAGWVQAMKSRLASSSESCLLLPPGCWIEMCRNRNFLKLRNTKYLLSEPPPAIFRLAVLRQRVHSDCTPVTITEILALLDGTFCSQREAPPLPFPVSVKLKVLGDSHWYSQSHAVCVFTTGSFLFKCNVLDVYPP